jgi:hypothetical protein
MEHAMTNPSIDPARFLHEHLTAASPDLLRSLLTTFIDTLMSAEADAVCGAEYGTSSAERVNTRNGYRHRDFDTRAGTLDVAIPKLRSGSYFPDWLLERRKRAEAALTSVVATCYLLGVSTRRMDKLVESLGITRMSKSQVSVMAGHLDAHVASFRTRPLDAGPYTFVAADAPVLKVRDGGRVVNVHALVATGVNADGHREISWTRKHEGPASCAAQAGSNSYPGRSPRTAYAQHSAAASALPRCGRMSQLNWRTGVAHQPTEDTSGLRTCRAPVDASMACQVVSAVSMSRNRCRAV